MSVVGVGYTLVRSSGRSKMLFSKLITCKNNRAHKTGGYAKYSGDRIQGLSWPEIEGAGS